jgi:hypothetical protein
VINKIKMRKFRIKNYKLKMTMKFKNQSKVLLLGLVLTNSLNTVNSQDLIWANGLSGTTNESSSSIFVDAAGNSYLSGVYTSTTDFDPGPGVFNLTTSSVGSSDAFVSKYDANGNLIWAKSMGGTDVDAASSVAIDASGNVYVSGQFWGTADLDPGSSTFNLTSNGSYDAFILKLNAAGNFVWAKQIGGTGGDYADKIILDASGNVLVTGIFQGNVDFDPGTSTFPLATLGSNEIYLLKLTNSGDFVWAKQTEGELDIYVRGIAIDPSGNIILSGNFQGSVDMDGGSGNLELTAQGADDIFVAKFNSTGDVLWAKSFGGSDFDYGQSVATDASGNIFATGSFKQIVDFSTGTSSSVLTSYNASEDVCIFKLNSSGALEWVKQFGGDGVDRPYEITVNNSNIYTTGFFSETADFDPSAGSLSLISNGSLDAFVLKLDLSGNLDWAVQNGGDQAEIGYSIDVQGESIYSTGTFNNVVDFDPSASSSNLTSLGLSDVYIQKLSVDPLLAVNNMESEEVKIYPNPNNGHFSVFFSAAANEPFTLSVYDVLGKVVYKEQILDFDAFNAKPFDLPSIKDGVYTLVMEKSKSSLSKKLVIRM